MPSDDRGYFTVSEINAEVRALVEDGYSDVSVLGEISNFKAYSSGHLYFSLKDSDAQLRGVCFKSDARRLAIEPEDGMKVLARGRLTVYEKSGQYQLVARSMEEAGTGELEQAYRLLKEKLEKEGLFDPAHKKELPTYPFRIAVVTSRTGAAVRDVVATLRRRWPCVEILIFPVRVQGELAAPEIVNALARLPEVAGLDLIIMGRGGGSLEDLWAFNEEIVARAIYECPVPIVSAVGHETDFTIADFVADVRAATPTMAAEIAVPMASDVIAAVARYERRLVRFMSGNVELRKRRLSELLRSYALGRVRGKIESHLQTHDYLMEKLRRHVGDVLRGRDTKLTELLTRLRGLDAKAILERGYAICADAGTGAVVRSVAGALDTAAMRVTFRDGSVLTRVKEKVDE